MLLPEILDELITMNPSEMTPLEAIQRLQEWKERFGP